MDPRRKPENKTSYLKTAGLGAAIAISGISFHRRTLTNRETILSTIQHSIDKMEKFSPSLSLSKQEMRDKMIRDFRESYETPPEYRKYRFSEEWENRKKDIELEFGDDIDIKSLVEYGDYIPESIDDIINTNLNKLQVDIHKLQERIDNINHQVLFPDETSKTAADKMAGIDLEGSTTRTLKSLEKEYPGIKAVFASMGISRGGTEFKIKNARILGMNYIIDITDGKKSQRVSIPQLESGMAFWKGYSMKPSIPASLKNGIVDAQEMGKLIVEKMHDNSKFTGTKKLFQVAKAIENSISIYLNGGLGVSTVHELTSMTTHLFHISKFQNMADDALTSGKLNVRKDLNEVYPRLISTSNISIREHLKRPHLSYKGDSRGLSEVSAQKFRYRSELAVGVYPGTRYDKVSQARGNFMPGPLIRGRKGIRTDTYLPSRLGPMSVDVIEHMNKHMMSTIPGGMTNVMFIKSNRDMSFSGTGSGMFIERTGVNGMSNITKYTGSGRRSYTIPILATQSDGIKINTGYNTAIDKLISDFESNKNMKLRAGEVIGKSRIFNGKKIERDANVWHMEIKNNHLVIYVEEEIGLHVGSKFDNKLMISNITDSAKINTMAAREKRTRSRSVISRLLQDKHAIPLSVDFVTEIDSHSKFTGGQMGMGLIQKVIKDISILEGSRIKSTSLQNMFREIMTELIGPDVDKLIETIKIDKRTKDPAVILKRNPGGDPITTAHAGFSGLLDLESAMKDAIEFNDLRRLKVYQKKINRVFKKYGTIQYRLLEENASNALYMGYVPAFVSGIDGNPNSLGMTITAPMTQHEISAYNYTKTSSMDRNSRGWGNTFRSTLDHYENSYVGGTDKFTKYMDSILGYNNSYILDKMFATEGKTFSNETELAKEFAEKKPGSKRRSSFKNFTKHEIINLEKEGLLDRLASYSFETQSMKVAGKFRVLEKDVSGLQGMVSDETMAKMINNEIIDLEDIRDTTRTGMGRFSVDVTDKKLFSDIVDMMIEKSGQDDTAFYLDLGKKAEDIGVMINGRKSRFIPIHKFDATDVFELQGAMSVEGNMTNYTQKYVTGSMYHSNLMALLKRAAEFIKVINDEATDEKKGRQAARALELAVNDYHKGLVKASKGKHSPLLDKMFEVHMPFSMRSILNFAPSTTSTNLTASESAALDSVYLHSDDAIKLITNNRVTSVAGAKSFVENMNTAKKDLEYLKKYMNISGEDVIAAATDDIVKASLSLDKMFKNIDMSALDKDTSSNLHKLRTALDPGGRGSLEDRIRKMSSSQKEQIMELHTTIRNSLMVENIHDQSPLRKVSEIYQYAINTIEEMKAGKVNIMGKLVGSPELSPLSMDYLNVKLIDNDKVSGLDLVNVSGKRLGDSAARIYTSKETAKRISRDFDADPIGFLITTFDVLEEQANKINGFSILKEAGLEHLKGGDLTRNLTHESIAHTILGRLLQIKDETGADLLKLKPASLTSVTMASLLSEVGNQNNILKSSLDEKIKEYVDSTYGHLNQAERDRTYRSVKNIVMDQVHAMKGNEIKVEHLAVVEKILYQRDMDLDTKDIKTKGQAHAEASKEPGRIEKFYLDTLDDIDIDARDKILEINKEAYANFRENMIKKSERFKLIKEATPEAYALTKGLITMSQYYSLGDRERMFMVAYADKIIAQNTISSKHGTPQILPNLKKLIRDMSNPDSTVSETAIERMVTGNLHVQLDKNVVEEIKRSGKADILRDIDINTYSKYLKEKEEYLSELAKVHNVTTKEIYEKKITNKILDSQLEKEYNSLFNINLANNKVLSSMHKYDPVTGSISGLQPMYMSPRYVADEFAKNAEAIKAVGKIKSTITDFTEFFTNGTKEQGMDLVRSVQTSLRLYSRMNNVRSVIDDPNIKLFRSFDGPKVTNMFELYDAMHGKIGQLTSGEIESIRVSSPAQARVAKIVSDIHKDRMDKRTVISGPSSEDLQQSMESLRRKETNVLQREYTKRLADESTVFRSGSLLESITGQIRKITASAADDAAVERSGRSLRTNLLTGIFVGTIIGQAANQILNGYSVPDLKYINGMGGEHYENKGGILGNENEVFLSPRPPRITPTGAAESRAMMSHSMMQDLALIESGIPPVQQYKSARRGAYVR